MAEVLGGVSLANYSVDEFVAIARALRVRCSQPLQSAAVKMHIAFEQWQLVQYSGGALQTEACGALFGDAARALTPLADAATLLLGHAQIVSSFLISLPRLDWPEPFVSLARLLGLLSLDLAPLFAAQPIGEAVGDALHGAATPLLLASALLALLLALPLTSGLLALLRRPPAELREAFYDRCVQLAVGVAFVCYPVLCTRLLLLFHYERYNDLAVLSTDVRVRADALGGWQAAAAPFVGLYVAGIPLAFAAVLWWAVRPALMLEHTGADAAQTLKSERRCLQRFSLLFAKYTPECYWYGPPDLAPSSASPPPPDLHLPGTR